MNVLNFLDFEQIVIMHSQLLAAGLVYLAALAVAHQEPSTQRVVGEEEQAELLRKWDFEVGETSSSESKFC